MAPWLENTLLFTVDKLFAALPQRHPTLMQVEQVKLVSHRGERDGVRVIENTFAAFDPIIEHGIWGIELDIRWTKDLVPVVIHDRDAGRVFGKDIVIAEHSWQECQSALPLMPSLEQLLDRYARHCHLMIEIKAEPYRQPDIQKSILQALLAPYTPGDDYHVISLDTALFQHVDFLPAKALLPVSTTNAASLSSYALEHALGGVTGHYLFMDKNIIRKHHDAGQAVGSGFANSRNVLFREIHKGCDWIFSNSALAMHHILQQTQE